MIESISDNIRNVQDRIAKAASRSGRLPEAVALLAVSKRVSSDRILEAVRSGVGMFGENYIQEALGKIQDPLLADVPLDWRFIGHLQSNKVKDAIGRFALIQSVDSLSLAKAIGKRAASIGATVDILFEIKLDNADTKFGIDPCETAETVAQASEIPGIRVRGLMGMPPYAPEPESSRPFFRALKLLFDALPIANQQTLSMGMSGDFEIAIEEGSTQVRIGTALFGSRQ